MTDKEYLDAAEAALSAIEANCDRLNDQTDVDIDNLRNGDVVNLVFRNGSQIVVNLQKPLQEIWLAAHAGGYHFKRNEQGQWHDTREGLELFAALSRFATEQAGATVTFQEA